ncbi:hypothetical protein [Actinoplanes regularis]|uniref:Uncharacterized protein n=1 Tax=Actinoplanes regularis TaxID=52697 RepID=A0A239JNW2_9ACTN|nr:hypothetical protein [Actinoplanes regularis]GIE92094.1 hypothetical protein Are01nite_85740 [Actinoplanes regularis]SNT07232.1 hypothetical protein SAMN06264365_13657 [Actinoplanes regularis]
MDAAAWVGLVAAAVATVAAVFAAQQAKCARRQAIAAEQEVADNRAERERSSLAQGRLAAVEYHHAVTLYVQALHAAAESGEMRDAVQEREQAAHSSLLRAVNGAADPELVREIIDLWQQVRLVELIHHRLNGDLDPALLKDLREAVILTRVVAISLTSKLGNPVWTDPPLVLSRDLPPHDHINSPCMSHCFSDGSHHEASSRELRPLTGVAVATAVRNGPIKPP